MIALMKPGETVAKSIRRLGGGGKQLSASARWKAKKAAKLDADKDTLDDKQKTADKESMLELTALADKIVSSGKMDIYQDTFEKISYMIKTEEEKAQKEAADSRTVIPEGTEDDDALDMFADKLDSSKETAAKMSENQAERKKEETGRFIAFLIWHA